MIQGILLATVVLGLGFFMYHQPAPPLQVVPALAADVPHTVDMGAASGLQAEFSMAVKKSVPAVVSVLASKVTKVSDSMPNDPLFRQFFGSVVPDFRNAPRQREQGLGSGVLISNDGYLVTNSHVVDGAENVRVVLPDHREFDAKVVGQDTRTDLALLKIDGSDLPTLSFAPSKKPDVGDIVFAIGNPFGVGQTVTMGIVSATGRGNLGIEDYEDFIQTDAAINPGNSGGALVNVKGELVGINTAIIGSGGNDGVGFAIPVQMMDQVVSQLRDHGHVVRGYIGAYVQDLTPEIATALNLSQVSGGALISDLTADGPGAKAGLKRGDVVVAMNGEPISDARRLRLKIAETAPGTAVDLKVNRAGQEVNLTLKPGELPEPDAQASDSGNAAEGSLRGLSVQALTPEVRQSLGAPADVRGVVVTDVDPASPAASAGIRSGDVIQEVNRHAVTTPDELKGAFRSAPAGGVLVLVNRQGSTFFAVIAAK